LIALGATIAVVVTGGPLIPFSYGRIQATFPGFDNVPQPQEDLATHIEEFKLMGFTSTEMISLVACGHTIGGVRNPDFTIVPPANDTFNGFEGFDTTFSTFDDNM
jgi:catalase (peroxidase I)